MDSEYSHSEVVPDRVLVVAADDYPHTKVMVEAYIRGRYHHDEGFTLAEVECLDKVDAIIWPPQYRL